MITSHHRKIIRWEFSFKTRRYYPRTLTCIELFNPDVQPNMNKCDAYQKVNIMDAFFRVVLDNSMRRMHFSLIKCSVLLFNSCAVTRIVIYTAAETRTLSDLYVIQVYCQTRGWPTCWNRYGPILVNVFKSECVMTCHKDWRTVMKIQASVGALCHFLGRVVEFCVLTVLKIEFFTNNSVVLNAEFEMTFFTSFLEYSKNFQFAVVSGFH